jgi:hypothetical protein
MSTARRAGLWPEKSHDTGVPRRPRVQHEAMPVDGKAGGLAVLDHVVLGQLRDPADQHPEQQHERSPDPQVQGHGLVGEAPVKLLDMVALSEQPGRFLA